MRYTIQHLVGSIVLIIAQATAFFMHEIYISIVFGLCQVPFGMLCAYTLFTNIVEKNGADNIGIEQEYQNFKKVVKKQIQKRRIKNVARWLCMMRDYRDEIMVLYIEKYLKEEIDKD